MAEIFEVRPTELEILNDEIKNQSRDLVNNLTTNNRFRIPCVLTCRTWALGSEALTKLQAETPEERNNGKINLVDSIITYAAQRKADGLLNTVENLRRAAVGAAILQNAGATDVAPIAFAHNPTEITFNLVQRGVRKKIKSGEALHFASSQDRLDNLGRYWDELTLNITFQTGNILPDFESEVEGSGLPSGVRDYYRFLELNDQPGIIPAGFQEAGEPNYRILSFNTRLWPDFSCQGFFDPTQIGTVTESATNPNYVQWSAVFVVHKIDNGSLKHWPTMRQSYLNGRNQV